MSRAIVTKRRGEKARGGGGAARTNFGLCAGSPTGTSRHLASHPHGGCSSFRIGRFSPIANRTGVIVRDGIAEPDFR